MNSLLGSRLDTGFQITRRYNLGLMAGFFKPSSNYILLQMGVSLEGIEGPAKLGVFSVSIIDNLSILRQFWQQASRISRMQLRINPHVNGRWKILKYL